MVLSCLSTDGRPISIRNSYLDENKESKKVGYAF